MAACHFIVVELLIEQVIILAAGSLVTQFGLHCCLNLVHGSEKGFQGVLYLPKDTAVIGDICKLITLDRKSVV